ncbi:ribosome maturation factor RimP [Desulfonauticus submarinus]|uniref:Ribosome maturation factor RimP n=1 Tax=Desulfonauticus submarinus TaxID=206665 RepID=A0A1H0AKT7_9BACT|nr:ribosome maturation factor RimP [Desulfonauticus submarinus]SDN33951.1 ribosome maturation factor RimP [Desulfonauticus submarinus]
MDKNLQQSLEDLIKEQCALHQLEYWGIEISFGRGKKGLLRIYIDKENGITIDELAKFSRELEVVLDIEDIIPGSYNLEVSSPGLNRKFFHPNQLKRFIGQSIKVKLKEPINKQKVFKGKLIKVEQNIFFLQTDKQEIKIDFFETEKVNLEYKF